MYDILVFGNDIGYGAKLFEIAIHQQDIGGHNPAAIYLALSVLQRRIVYGYNGAENHQYKGKRY